MRLTPAQFPVGYITNPQGTLNSGDTVSTAPPLHDPQHLTCADLLTELWRTGFGETAMATNSIVSATQGADYSEAVYRFASDSAAGVFYEGLETTWGVCGTINAGIAANVTARLTVTRVNAPSGVGTQDFAIDVAGTEGSYNRLSETVALSGVDVFLSSTARLGNAAPPGLDSTSLLRELMAAVGRLG